MQKEVAPVGRLAPSPSGRMHLGNLFAALLAWLSVKSRGGKIILRMENLDPLRTSFAYADLIMEDLAWYGLEWDEGPRERDIKNKYYQINRNKFYNFCIDHLERTQQVYPCFCSRAQLHAAAAPHASDGNYVYDGRCRGLTAQQRQEMLRCRPGALRVAVPDETICFADGLQGQFCQNLAQEAGDFILRRSDGIYAYMLCAPADDGEMGVTEVVRGRDLLASTPSQIWLMEALGYAPPHYVHIPMLLTPDGRRLSKRDKDLDLGMIRAGSKDPRPLLGALAHMAGFLDRNEAISARELLAEFSWERVRPGDIPVSAVALGEGVL